MRRLNDIHNDSNGSNVYDDTAVNDVHIVRGAHSMFRNSARRFFSAISFS